jgi:flagellar protein FliT
MLLEYYRAIEASSYRMLEAAKSADWDAMVRCEGACAVLIQQLRETARQETLDASMCAEKSRIMLRILKNDAEVRSLLEPWLDHCSVHIGQPHLLH